MYNLTFKYDDNREKQVFLEEKEELNKILDLLTDNTRAELYILFSISHKNSRALYAIRKYSIRGFSVYVDDEASKDDDGNMFRRNSLDEIEYLGPVVKLEGFKYNDFDFVCDDNTTTE